MAERRPGTNPPIHLVRLGRGPGDRQVLRGVLEGAPGYARRVKGTPPPPDAAEQLLASLPEGTSREDKYTFAVLAGDRAVGCADVVRGYPDAETAFVGLLLIVERYQGQGLGAAAYAELEALARGWGCRSIRLAVVEANGQVLGFWEKLGFAATGERWPYTAGPVQSGLVALEKQLLSHA
jgi:GNAT superfamily N-acetyltransferase